VTDARGELRLIIKVVPGASRDRIVGALGDALKIAVSRPPEGGAANQAVLKLLAAALGVPVGQVRIVRGHSSPRKQIAIRGLSPDALNQRLAELTASK
jgi:hypothetical protein